MNSANEVPIGDRYQNVTEVIAGLKRLEAYFLERRDRRGVFVLAYRIISETLEHWIERRRFHDNDWVRGYIVSFANLYRDALEATVARRPSELPRSWRIALETSEAGMALVFQDLMLGINAHINRDLAFALEQVGIDGEKRYEDHTLVNLALSEATGIVQDRLAEYYASGLGVLDRALGNLDEELTRFNFEVAREHAWTSAVALVQASSDSQRQLVADMIERQAEWLARELLTPNVQFPWLIEVLRYLEQRKPWWESFVSFHQEPLAAPPAASNCDPVASLDEVIARLSEFITRWDADRDRLSVYATVYRRITQKVKSLVEAGGFRDPDWMVDLDVRFANRYIDVVCKFEEGRIDEIPKCWALAFETVRNGRSMMVQDIGVQIAPRVVYDLPITLVETGMSGNMEDRKHDYEKTYQLFIDELDCIQKMIAKKYSRLVTYMDILAGRLDETLTNILYTRARTEAWKDAINLRDASDDEREQIIRDLDRKALRGMNKMLFYHLPPLSWMVAGVRRLEDAFEGDWSDSIVECDEQD